MDKYLLKIIDEMEKGVRPFSKNEIVEAAWPLYIDTPRGRHKKAEEDCFFFAMDMYDIHQNKL